MGNVIGGKRGEGDRRISNNRAGQFFSSFRIRYEELLARNLGVGNIGPDPTEDQSSESKWEEGKKRRTQGHFIPSIILQRLGMQLQFMEEDDYATSLDLTNTYLGNEAVIALCDSLRSNCVCNLLGLSRTGFTLAGTAAIAQTIPLVESLADLDLSNNQIGVPGASYLGAALSAKGCKLKRLFLCHTNLNDEAAVSIAGSLVENTSLRVLDVSGNRIGGNGGGAFCRCLKMNYYLQSLNLEYNNVEPEQLVATKVFLGRNIIVCDLIDELIYGKEGAKMYREDRIFQWKYKSKSDTVRHPERHRGWSHRRLDIWRRNSVHSVSSVPIGSTADGNVSSSPPVGSRLPLPHLIEYAMKTDKDVTKGKKSSPLMQKIQTVFAVKRFTSRKRSSSDPDLSSANESESESNQYTITRRHSSAALGDMDISDTGADAEDEAATPLDSPTSGSPAEAVIGDDENISSLSIGVESPSNWAWVSNGIGSAGTPDEWRTDEIEEATKKRGMTRAMSLAKRYRDSKRFDHGFAETIGRRATMEDATLCLGSFRGFPDEELYGVFDGHGGSQPSDYVARRLPELISASLAEDDREVCGILRDCFMSCNAEMESWCEFRGTTAAVALCIRDRIYIANTGDSRIVLCRNGDAIRASLDHKPSDPEERKRIESLGGFVKDGRISGMLAVSRAFGDKFLAPFVTVKPFLNILDIDDDEDEFMIIACDGLWDVVSDKRAVELVREFVDPSEAAEALRDHAYAAGSCDNISVVVVFFSKLEEAERYKEMEERMEDERRKYLEKKAEIQAKRESEPGSTASGLHSTTLDFSA